MAVGSTYPGVWHQTRVQERGYPFAIDALPFAPAPRRLPASRYRYPPWRRIRRDCREMVGPLTSLWYALTDSRSGSNTVPVEQRFETRGWKRLDYTEQREKGKVRFIALATASAPSFRTSLGREAGIGIHRRRRKPP